MIPSRFPCGLIQPPGSLRFGQDALLLSSFGNMILKIFRASYANKIKAAEIGCGCGAVILGMALENAALEGLGIDLAEELVEAARENAENLGVVHQVKFIQANVRQSFKNSPAARYGGEYDLILANPP